MRRPPPRRARASAGRWSTSRWGSRCADRRGFHEATVAGEACSKVDEPDATWPVYGVVTEARRLWPLRRRWRRWGRPRDCSVRPLRPDGADAELAADRRASTSLSAGPVRQAVSGHGVRVGCRTCTRAGGPGPWRGRSSPRGACPPPTFQDGSVRRVGAGRAGTTAGPDPRANRGAASSRALRRSSASGPSTSCLTTTGVPDTSARHAVTVDCWPCAAPAAAHADTGPQLLRKLVPASWGHGPQMPPGRLPCARTAPSRCRRTSIPSTRPS